MSQGKHRKYDHTAILSRDTLVDCKGWKGGK